MSGIAAAVSVAFAAGVAEGTSVLRHCYSRAEVDDSTNSVSVKHDDEDGSGSGSGSGQFESSSEQQLQSQAQSQSTPKLVLPSIVYGTLAVPMTAVGSSPSIELVARFTNLTLPSEAKIHDLNLGSDLGMGMGMKMEIGTKPGVDDSKPVIEGGNGGEIIGENESSSSSSPSYAGSGSSSDSNNNNNNSSITNGNNSSNSISTGNNPRRMMKFGFPGNGRVLSISDNNNNNNNRSPRDALRNPAGGLDVQRFREDNRKALAAMRERKLQIEQENETKQNQNQDHGGQNAHQEDKNIDFNVEAAAGKVAEEARLQSSSVQRSGSRHLPLKARSNMHASPFTLASASASSIAVLDGRVLPTKMAQNMRGLRIFALGYGLIHATIAHQVRKSEEDQRRREEYRRQVARGRDPMFVQKFMAHQHSSGGTRSTCGASSNNHNGIALRLMDDHKQLLDMMRDNRSSSHGGGTKGDDDSRPVTLPTIPCALPIVCSDEHVQIPSYETSSSQSDVQLVPFDGGVGKDEETWQDSLLSTTITSQLSHVRTWLLQEIQNLVSGTMNESNTKEGIEAEGSFDAQGGAMAWMQEYGKRLRDLVLTIPGYLPLSADTILSNSNQDRSSALSQTQQLPLPWWSLGNTEEEWKEFPLSECIYIHDENKKGGTYQQGIPVVLLESNLSTSIMDGISLRNGKNPTSSKSAATMRADLNARKMQHIVKDRIKGANDVSLVHVLLGTNVDSSHNGACSNIDILPCQKIVINSLDSVVMNIVKKLKEREMKNVTNQINSDDGTTHQINSDEGTIDPNSTLVISSQETRNNDNKDATDSDVHPMTVLTEHSVNEPIWSAVDRLGREIRHIGVYAISLPTSAVESIGRNLRHCAAYAISLPTSAVESIGRNIRHCGAMAVGHLASVRVGMRSLLLLPGRGMNSSRTHPRTRIHVITDNEDIATWLRESLSPHGFLVNAVVWDNDDFVKSKLAMNASSSSSSSSSNDDDYYLFVNSSDDVTLHSAAKGLSFLKMHYNGDLTGRRVITVVEGSKTKETLKSFLGEDSEHVPIICVSSIHQDLFASTRLAFFGEK